MYLHFRPYKIVHVFLQWAGSLTGGLKSKILEKKLKDEGVHAS